MLSMVPAGREGISFVRCVIGSDHEGLGSAACVVAERIAFIGCVCNRLTNSSCLITVILVFSVS